MLKNKKYMLLPILLIVFAIAIFAFVNIFFFKKDKTTNSSTDESSEQSSGSENNQSPFGRFNQKTDENLIPRRQPEEVNEEVLLTKEEYYWSGWHHKDKMILAVVQKVNKIDSEMDIIIKLPNEKATEGGRVSRVQVNCPVVDSHLIKGSEPEQIIKSGGFDILDVADFQDRLYAYCIDENCQNIGIECVLTDISL